jgi:hypothetical protein
MSTATPVRRIGTVTTSGAIEIARDDGSTAELPGGFDHFASGS